MGVVLNALNSEMARCRIKESEIWKSWENNSTKKGTLVCHLGVIQCIFIIIGMTEYILITISRSMALLYIILLELHIKCGERAFRL